MEKSKAICGTAMCRGNLQNIKGMKKWEQKSCLFLALIWLYGRIKMETNHWQFWHSDLCTVFVTFHATGKTNFWKKLLLLTKSLIIYLKLLLFFMNVVSFHFSIRNTDLGYFKPAFIRLMMLAEWITHAYISNFIHMSFELCLFYTSYPEFRPWKIELLVEL